MVLLTSAWTSLELREGHKIDMPPPNTHTHTHTHSLCLLVQSNLLFKSIRNIKGCTAIFGICMLIFFHNFNHKGKVLRKNVHIRYLCHNVEHNTASHTCFPQYGPALVVKITPSKHLSTQKCQVTIQVVFLDLAF